MMVNDGSFLEAISFFGIFDGRHRTQSQIMKSSSPIINPQKHKPIEYTTGHHEFKLNTNKTQNRNK